MRVGPSIFDPLNLQYMVGTDKRILSPGFKTYSEAEDWQVTVPSSVMRSSSQSLI